jgi:hypothetical protein
MVTRFFVIASCSTVIWCHDCSYPEVVRSKDLWSTSACWFIVYSVAEESIPNRSGIMCTGGPRSRLWKGLLTGKQLEMVGVTSNKPYRNPWGLSFKPPVQMVWQWALITRQLLWHPNSGNWLLWCGRGWLLSCHMIGESWKMMTPIHVHRPFWPSCIRLTQPRYKVFMGHWH